MKNALADNNYVHSEQNCDFSFNMQLFALTGDLPDNPNTASATVGKDYLVFINTGTVAVPTWTVVGGQRGASLGMSADEIDVSSKSSGGWSSKLAGLKSWNIDLDGLLLLNDAGIEALRRAFKQSKQVNIKLLYPDGNYQVGWASITDFSSDTPHDGEATLKGTLNGVGPISDISVIVSKAEATDQTFYFEKSATATKLKLGETSVAAESYIATEEGQITLKTEYLAALEAKECIFYADLSIGGQAIFIIKMTA